MYLRIVAALAIAAGAACTAVTAVHGQEGTQTPAAGTSTPTTGGGTETPTAGGTSTPAATTSTPVATSTSGAQLPSTGLGGDGGSNSAGLLIALAGLTLLGGAAAVMFASRNRAGA